MASRLIPLGIFRTIFFVCFVFSTRCLTIKVFHCRPTSIRLRRRLSKCVREISSPPARNDGDLFFPYRVSFSAASRIGESLEGAVFLKKKTATCINMNVELKNSLARNGAARLPSRIIGVAKKKRIFSVWH